MALRPNTKNQINLKWIILGLLGGVIILAIVLAAFLPVWVVQWLGGKDFQRLASQQASSLLQTEGEFQSFEWSSFSVYTAGFQSRPGAVGPWIWDLQDIRTEISPRLLLDRILRFSEISIGRLALQAGTKAALAKEAVTRGAEPKGASAELFQDVQVGRIEIRDFELIPSLGTSGWGAKGVAAWCGSFRNEHFSLFPCFSPSQLDDSICSGNLPISRGCLWSVAALFFGHGGSHLPLSRHLELVLFFGAGISW